MDFYDRRRYQNAPGNGSLIGVLEGRKDRGLHHRTIYVMVSFQPEFNSRGRASLQAADLFEEIALISENIIRHETILNASIEGD